VCITRNKEDAINTTTSAGTESNLEVTTITSATSASSSGKQDGATGTRCHACASSYLEVTTLGCTTTG
jgi:hypothetical protein